MRRPILLLSTILVSLLLPSAPAGATRSAADIFVATWGTASNDPTVAGNCVGAPTYKGSAGFVTAVSTAVAGDVITLCGDETTTYSLLAPLTVNVPLTLVGENSDQGLPSVEGSSIRLLDIAVTGEVEIEGVRFADGLTPAGQAGGAIRLVSGNLNLYRVLFENNQALTNGGAVAIANPAGTSEVVVNASAFVGNEAGAAGGAIYETGGNTVRILNSLFTANSAGAGAAAFAGSSASTSTVTFSSIVDNTTSGAVSGATIKNSLLATSSANCLTGITDGGGNLATDSSCGWSTTWSSGSSDSSAVATRAQLRLGRIYPSSTGGVPSIRVLKGSAAEDYLIGVPAANSDVEGTARPTHLKSEVGQTERASNLNSRTAGASALTYSATSFDYGALEANAVIDSVTLKTFNPGVPVGYYSMTPGVCSVDQSTADVTVLTAGSCVVEAYAPSSISGSTRYEEAVDYTTLTFVNYATPSTPRTVTVTPTVGGLSVVWTAPASNGGAALTYKVTADPDVAGGKLTIRENCSSPCAITGLVAGAKYSVIIEPSNGFYSAPYVFDNSGSFFKPLAPVLPTKPLFVAVIPGKASAMVIWQRPASTGRTPLTKYVIRTYLKSKPTKLLKEFTAKPTLTRINVKGLPSKKAIIFKVFAVNGGGISPASAAVTATTK